MSKNGRLLKGSGLFNPHTKEIYQLVVNQASSLKCLKLPVFRPGIRLRSRDAMFA